LFENSSRIRIAKYSDLLEPEARGLPMRAVERLQKGRERLSRIVQENEVGMDFQIGQPSMFEVFEQAHQEWAQGNGFVVFRDHPLLSGKPHSLIERVQPNGLCSMHAPIVLQHYLVAMQKNDRCWIWGCIYGDS
jgi:hypothetical protein